MPSVIMVMLSYLSFYLGPAVTPARTALGMLCLVVVMTNFVGLARILPPTASPPWLVRVMLYSFMFNVIAMVEHVSCSKIAPMSYPINAVTCMCLNNLTFVFKSSAFIVSLPAPRTCCCTFTVIFPLTFSLTIALHHAP